MTVRGAGELVVCADCNETTSHQEIIEARFCVVVTAHDFESGSRGSNPEWGPYAMYNVSITAGLIPEPSSLRSSSLGTRAAEHKDCNWACKLTDVCIITSCVRPHLQWNNILTYVIRPDDIQDRSCFTYL